MRNVTTRTTVEPTQEALAKVHQLSPRRPIQPKPEPVPTTSLRAQIESQGVREVSRVALRLIKEAEEQSALLLRDAKQRAEQSVQEATEAAYFEAEKKALAKLCDLGKLEAQFLRSAQQQLTEVCAAVCSQVLEAEPELLSTTISQRIEQVLSSYAQEGISIRLSSTDNLTQELKRSLCEHGIEIIPDETLPAGDFLLLTSAGQLQSNLAIHLDTLLQLLSVHPDSFFPKSCFTSLPQPEGCDVS